MIRGGYILTPRCIQESDVFKAPPHVREIWQWLLRQVNHTDTAICKRGQCIRSYKDMQEDLAWYVGYRKEKYAKHHCEKAMKWLKKATMVTTTKTTRGMVITVLNYDYFQNPENYESYTKADTKATMKLQGSDTINKNGNNGKKERNSSLYEKRSDLFSISKDVDMLRSKYEAAISDAYGRKVKVPAWGQREKVIARELLDGYGLHVCEYAIKHFVGIFEAEKRNRGWDGMPTINLLRGCGGWVFPEVVGILSKLEKVGSF